MFASYRRPVAGSLIVFALMLAEAGSPVHANDSSAAMAAGGLELVKNDQVRMVSEVLRIAPRLVEVDYVFENTGSTDVTTEVAFPLPELPASYESPIELAAPSDTNFVGFQILVDGLEIKPDVEVRAFAGTREITAELKRLGVDIVNPDLENRQIVEKLRALNLAEGDDTTSREADWVARVRFHWSQTFPVGKRVAVRHRYHPVHGAWHGNVDPNDQRVRVRKSDQRLGGQWCFDQSFNDAELRLFDRQYEAAAKQKGYVGNDFDVNYDSVLYVLKTGANWQGPIGRFELQIDKGGAEFISTCPIPGLHLQRTPYGFNAVANDYTPSSDLDILFVSGHWLGHPDGSGK
jgi:hypothetical protein